MIRRARNIQKLTIFAVSLIFMILESWLNIDVVEEDVPLSDDVKYMLLWTGNEDHPLDTFGDGQEVFIRNKCSFQNCYVTTNRNLLDDVRKFHALAFSGLHNLLKSRLTNLSNLPKSRSPRQKYIFFQSESSPRYPVCNDTFDEFFNWTATYRLSSDIPYPYIMAKAKNGGIVAPKRKVHWEKHLDDDEVRFPFHLNKSKAAAWFVTSCVSLGGREGFVARLQEALKPRGLKVDVYSNSNCGDLTCPRENETQCAEKLRHEYFFYLAFENSFDEDYVTEKILTALHNNVVPIVFGAADYSRFLPPRSYLNAMSRSPRLLAATMQRLIQSPQEYNNFFKWRNEYTYHNPWEKENVCSVCAALNNKIMMEKRTVYMKFRYWWHPQLRNPLYFYFRCRREFLEDGVEDLNYLRIYPAGKITRVDWVFWPTKQTTHVTSIR